MSAPTGSLPPVLVVMCRWPAFRRCKRRLGASIGPAAAASVQTRLTAHTLAVCSELAGAGLVNLRIAMSGGRRHPQNAGPWASFSDQGEGGLGLRMRRQLLKAHQSHPHHPLLMIGTDLPDLSRRDLCLAIQALQQHPLVLGPASDGGYWLLGLGPQLATTSPAWLFAGMPWGGDQVLKLTCARAQSRGVMPFLLAERNDIDRLEDLKPWLG